jgi:hypothetical protein
MAGDRLNTGHWSGAGVLMVALVCTALLLSPARAYNPETHQALVDYAWQIMLAVNADGTGRLPPDAAPFRGLTVSTDFSKRVQRAISNIQKLPSGLPAAHNKTCSDASVTDNWTAGDPSGMTLGQIRAAVGKDYISGNDCGIETWVTSSSYQLISGVDRSGTVLGFWAQRPDELDSEFRIGIKPTSVGALSLAKEALVAAGAVPAATVWVTAKCAWTCLKSVFTFSPSDCGDCCRDAVNNAVNATRDGVAEIDGVFPVVGFYKNPDVFTGMGHHIDVPLKNRDFDDTSGLLISRAGPRTVPGALELLATAGADALGLTVNYDHSDAPKNYEVPSADDGSPTRHRDAADWEFLPFPHTPMTPVDNLGWFGMKEFGTANPAATMNTPGLAFALHAIGDATVPMHVAGAFGWGHRPYEDAVAQLHPELMAQPASVEVPRLNTIILPRAEAYYKIIADWRAAHPMQRTEVPIRALVTEIARTTWSIVDSDPTVFNDELSVEYVVPLTKDASIVQYYTRLPVMKKLMEEAVAATIAFLAATGEVLP